MRVIGILLVSVVHLRQLEAAKFSKRKYWSDEDEEKAQAAEEEGLPELTEEERLNVPGSTSPAMCSRLLS